MNQYLYIAKYILPIIAVLCIYGYGEYKEKVGYNKAAEEARLSSEKESLAMQKIATYITNDLVKKIETFQSDQSAQTLALAELASAPIYNNECIDDAGLDFIRNKAKSK